MSIKKMRSALVEAFENGGLNIVATYDNTDFVPKAEHPWAQVFFAPNPPQTVTFGAQGMDEHTGTLGIYLRYPVHQGEGAVLAKADELREVFKHGSKFTYQGQEVLIRSSGLAGGAQIAEGFYSAFFNIEWLSRTQR